MLLFDGPPMLVAVTRDLDWTVLSFATNTLSKSEECWNTEGGRSIFLYIKKKKKLENKIKNKINTDTDRSQKKKKEDIRCPKRECLKEVLQESLLASACDVDCHGAGGLT